MAAGFISPAGARLSLAKEMQQADEQREETNVGVEGMEAAQLPASAKHVVVADHGKAEEGGGAPVEEKVPQVVEMGTGVVNGGMAAQLKGEMGKKDVLKGMLQKGPAHDAEGYAASRPSTVASRKSLYPRRLPLKVRVLPLVGAPLCTT